MRYNPTTGMFDQVAKTKVEPQIPDDIMGQEKISVVNSLGESFYITPDLLPTAQKAGYRYESPEEEEERKLHEQYGYRPFSAALLGGASGLTFSLSDWIARGLGYDETLREIKKRNAPAWVTGDIGSTIASLGVSAIGKAAVKGGAKILGGEAAEIAAKETAERIAKEGIESGVKTFDKPVGSILGVVEEVVSPTLQTLDQVAVPTVRRSLGKRILDLTEQAAGYTAPVLGEEISEKLAAKVFKDGYNKALLKGVIEGGIFGAKETSSDIALSEMDLEDLTPSMISDSLIANAGIGALLGGTLNLGMYGLGKAIKGSSKTLSSAVEKASKGDPLPESFFPDFVTEKENAKQLRQAIIDMGGNPDEIGREFLLADDKARAMIVERAKKGFSIAGSKERAKAAKLENLTDKYVMEMFDSIDEISFEDAGRELKRAIFANTNEEVMKAQNLYEAIIPDGKKIDVKWDDAKEVLKEMQKKNFYKSLSREDKRLLKDRLRGIDNLKLLWKIQSLYSEEAVSASITGKNEYSRSLFKIVRKLEKIEEAAIREYYRKNKPKGDLFSASDYAESVLSGKAAADAQYKKIHDDLADMFGMEGSEFVKGRIKWQSLLDKIQKTNDADFAKKILNPKKGSLENINKTFGKETRDLVMAYMTALKDEIMVDGRANVNKLLKATKSDGLTGIKVSNEWKEFVFKKTGVKKLENLRALSEAYPKRFVNHSNTASVVYDGIMATIISNVVDGATYAATYRNSSVIAQTITSVNKGIERAAKDFINPKGSKIKPMIIQSAVSISNNLGRKEIEKRMEKVTEVYTNPEILQDEIEKATRGFADDPNLQMQMQQKLIGSYMFLYEKMPKMKLTDPLRLRQIYMPSDQEISKWTRYIKAIERPMSIMDDLVAGVLTPESVDAVRTIYPDVYAKMGITLMEKVQASDKPLTMQQRVQLATFLGMPTSIAMNPQFLQMLQQNTGGLNQEQQSNQKTVLESDVAGRTMSATNSVIYRE